MAGNSSIESNQTVTFTDNMSFDGTDRGGAMTADGQLWIGATASNRANNGGHVRLGNITSPDGSITITNGAGTIGLSATGAAFAPNAVLQEFDDFISSDETGTHGSKLRWTRGSGSFYQKDGEDGHPGIWSFETIIPGEHTKQYIQTVDINGDPIDGPIILGEGETTINWVIRLGALSDGTDTYTFSCGLADGITVDGATNSFVNGCYFQYTHSVNSGNWQIKNTASSTTTTANTSTAATSVFVNLSIVINASATSVAYYIDGNQVDNSPLTTNIPSSALTPFWKMQNSAGTNPVVDTDLYWMTVILSNPRPGPAPSSGSVGNLIRKYTATATNYQVLTSDSIIGVTDTSAARTITMPDTNLIAAMEWTIKDETGGAATNNITIDGNGADVDGSATYVIANNYGSIDLYFNGSNFFVI